MGPSARTSTKCTGALLFQESDLSDMADIGVLKVDEKETIDAVLNYYGDKSSQWLSDLTHREDPWRDARNGTADGERSNVEITHGAMADYYGNL
jgi:uncharacterized phage-associated protein